jgi:hypothetical protein
MRVATPLGEYPLLLRRLERREGEVAVVGTMAGLEASLLLGGADLRAGALRVLPPVILLAGGLYLLGRRSRRPG